MPREKAITTSIYFNKYKPQKDGSCPISIRVTFNKEKKYYDTGKRMLPEDYERLYNPKPRSDQKAILSSLKNLEEKAQRIIDSLGKAFTFKTFERLFLTNQAFTNSLSGAFEDYISTIEPERVGTILNYKTSKVSIANFNPKAKISDVNVRF